MKKKIQLLIILMILLLTGKFLIVNKNQNIRLELDEDNAISVLLTANYKQQRIYPWYSESDDRYYFFLPAYCQSDFLLLNKIKENKIVSLNGMYVQSNRKFILEEEKTYQLEILTENANVDYDIIFLQSENLPAVFIGTDSGSMEYIHEDKGNEDAGSIEIVTADGNIEYNDRLSKISGRGNSTWRDEKKPYTIKLTDDKSLLGMDAADKWCLLSGWHEGAKMNSKAAFDMAELLGLDYNPQCTWIDLYLNGEYAGIYLLAESISVGQGRVNIYDLEKENKENNPNIDEADTFEENGVKGYVLNNSNNISGGYLFEKDFPAYWEMENSGFTTLKGNTFTIKSPQHASKEQVEYLSQYVQNIDDLLNEGNIEYRNYIDFTSFAKKYIVDEIALGFDVNVTSMFYYKKRNDDLLYAGPVWDFDGAFGEVNSDGPEGYLVNYESSAIYPFRSEDRTLNWYAKLYDDEVFRSLVIELYSDALPAIEELIETKIDIYADYIRKSVELDNIRWAYIDTRGDCPGHYTEFDNNIRYLRYFLAKRINYLNEKWAVNYHELALPNTGGTHKVSFCLGEELIETREVSDGETLSELPYLDENLFLGWYFTYSDEKYRIHLPIYEDTAFYAKPKADN